VEAFGALCVAAGAVLAVLFAVPLFWWWLTVKHAAERWPAIETEVERGEVTVGEGAFRSGTVAERERVVIPGGVPSSLKSLTFVSYLIGQFVAPIAAVAFGFIGMAVDDLLRGRGSLGSLLYGALVLSLAAAQVYALANVWSTGTLATEGTYERASERARRTKRAVLVANVPLALLGLLWTVTQSPCGGAIVLVALAIIAFSRSAAATIEEHRGRYAAAARARANSSTGVRVEPSLAAPAVDGLSEPVAVMVERDAVLAARAKKTE
jgi:hypothetical protein